MCTSDPNELSTLCYSRGQERALRCIPPAQVYYVVVDLIITGHSNWTMNAIREVNE